MNATLIFDGPFGRRRYQLQDLARFEVSFRPAFDAPPAPAGRLPQLAEIMLDGELVEEVAVPEPTAEEKNEQSAGLELRHAIAQLLPQIGNPARPIRPYEIGEILLDAATRYDRRTA